MAVVEDFEEHRRHLIGVAYRMLGSVSEAEDVVQDTWLRWRAAADEVRSPRSYLTTVATRLAIDRLRSAQHRREEYVGPWLPEPLVTDDDPAATAELADSLSVAFLLLLERLNPVERAVLLLHDVFGYDYDEVAAIVDRTPTNCRQIASRARGHLTGERPVRPRPPLEEEQRLAFAFAAAAGSGDLAALEGLLAEDVVLWSDGGPNRRAARRPVVGRGRVARLVANLSHRLPTDGTYEFVHLNGEPALIVRTAEGPFLTMAVDVGDGVVRAIHTVVNPDKLRHLAAPGG
ncbi:MAG: polymerase subunit sigma-24 [Acidimicrobiales bacterium]|nr:polymerase subunit sigma-24 [Acidimicrobiales bacterium]